MKTIQIPGRIPHQIADSALGHFLKSHPGALVLGTSTDTPKPAGAKHPTRMTKQELAAELLRDFGFDPPDRWNRPQLVSKVAKLRAQAGNSN